MPIYDLKCSCGHRFEAVCRYEDRDGQPCPKCGKTKAAPQVTKPQRERGFAGSEEESIMYGFADEDVNTARRNYADTGATIRDDGVVKFATRGQQKKFTKRWGQLGGTAGT